MRQTISIFIIGLLVLTGCFAPGNIVETRPVLAGDTLSLRGHVYFLPRTSFKINLEVVKTRTIRGPYYRFAEKLLSIRDVPDRNSSNYRISKLNLESFQ
ncbi:MAG: DUF4831 family protein, partial [Bacteroidales bacterium]|nr:DUF4831 family protein [Bacteroidales bacterium]